MRMVENDSLGAVMRLLIALLSACFCGVAVNAQEAAPESPADASPEPTPIVLVVGAGGTDEYAGQFRAWADQWSEVAEKTGADVTQIGRDDTDTPDRDRLEKAIKSLKSEGPTPVWIVLIGHGTFARGVAKFNLRGRDVSALELSQWLESVDRTVVIVNCASASGPFVNRLSGPKRVIVTATKSGVEQNYARFGKYFAEAIASAESDLDHDDEVSVHEAFLRASASVQRFYDSEERISTEHSLIDDNGDGKGTPAKMFRGTRVIASAKDGSQLDGKKASRITLALTKNRLPLTPDELTQREEIERELDRLIGEKDSLEEEAYDQQLKPLMIRLAMIYRAAEQRAAEQQAADDE